MNAVRITPILIFILMVCWGKTIAQSISADKQIVLLMEQAEGKRFPINLSAHTANKVIIRGLLAGQTYDVWVSDRLEDGSLNTAIVEGSQGLLLKPSEQSNKYSFKALASEASLFLNMSTWRSRAPLQQTYISIRQRGKRKTPPPHNSIPPPQLGAESLPPISVDPSQNCPEVVEEVFVGGNCFDVQNIQQIGPNPAIGTFSGGMESIGIEEGVIISSGNITNALGPNNQTGAGNGLGFPGDGDLNQLSSSTTNDAVGFTFEFVPTDTVVTFDYVFASDEYCEYVNAAFNDAFGFFISGPGIAGPYSNGAENIALLPNGATVTINTVNHLLNSGFFVRNSDNPVDECGAAAYPTLIEYDGFTTVLTATASVIPCSTYQLKLVVADVVDDIYDSAVFLKSNSFVASDLVGVSSELTLPTGNVLYENCGQNCFVFRRQGSEGNNTDVVVDYTINSNSTATAGVDYTALPDPLIIPAGQDSIVVCIDAFEDGIMDSLETIIINIENSCQCEGLNDTVFIQDYPPFETAAQGDTICGTGPATISVDVSGGVPVYDYLWSNNEITPEITVNPPGSGSTFYNVVVTDVCGNTSFEQVEILRNLLPVAIPALTGDEVLCNGNSEIFIEVTFSGQAPFSVVYAQDGLIDTIKNINANPYQLSVTEAGFYNFLTVIDAFGCENAINSTFNIGYFELQIDFESEGPACPEIENGFVQAGTTNGLRPLFFNWDNGSPFERIEDLPEGTYCVTVTDANNCSAEGCETIVAEDPLEVSISQTREVNCQDRGGRLRADVSNTGGQAASFLWSNNATTSQIADLASGTYSVTVSTPVGCTAIDTITIVAPESFELSLEPLGDIDCDKPFDGGINLVTNRGTPPFIYNWGDGPISEDRANLPAGTYTVTVLDDNDCLEVDTVTLTGEFEDPSIGIEPPDTLDCARLSVELIGSGNSIDQDVSFLWSTGNGVIISGMTDSTALAGAAGVYTLTVTDTSSGCLVDSTIEVLDISALPTVDAGVQARLDCAIDSLQLNGSASGSTTNLSYSWTATEGGRIRNGADSLIPIIDAAGKYALQVTDLRNNCINTDTVLITIDTLAPLAAAGIDLVLNCEDTTISLDGSASSRGGDFSYTWTTTNGNILSGENTLSPVVDREGLYRLLVTNTDNQCVAADSMIVSLSSEIPVADAGPDLIYNCVDTVFEIDGTNSERGPNITYAWEASNGGNIVSGAGSSTPTVDAPGIYTLTVTNRDNGCVNTDFIEITTDTVRPVAIAISRDTLTCSILSISLDGRGSSTGPDFVYTWSTSNGQIISGVNALDPTVSRAGQYTLNVLDISNGCSNAATTEAIADRAFPLANILAPDTLDCVTDEVPLVANTSVGTRFTYAWSTDVNGEFSAAQDASNTLVRAAAQYVFTVTDTVNDCQTVDSVRVLIDTLYPFVDVADVDTVNCYEPLITVGGSASSIGAAFNYSWTTNTGRIIGATNQPTAQTDTSGTYTLRILNTQNGCESIDSLPVIADLQAPLAEAGSGVELNCLLTEVNLNGSGSSVGNEFRYNWSIISSIGNIVSGETSLSPLINQPGTYQIEVTDISNGCTALDEVVITQDANLPIANAGPARRLTCDTTSLILDGRNSSQTVNVTYEWTTQGGGNIVADANSLTPTVDAPGTYLLTIVDTVNSCIVTSTVDVSQDIQLPIVDIAPATVLNCDIQELMLDGRGSDQGSIYTYQWQSNDGNILTGAGGLTPTIDAPGSYTLISQNTDNGCIDSAIIDIQQDTIAPMLTVLQPAEITCADPLVTLRSEGSSTGGNFDYEWTTSNGAIDGDATREDVVVSAAGTYLLEITNTDNGCVSTGDVLVIENRTDPLLTASIPEELNCAILDIDLSISAMTQNGNLVSFNWTDENNASLGNDSTLNVEAPGRYSVRVVDAVNGCASETEILVLQDTATPVAAYAMPDTLTCALTTLSLEATNVSQGDRFSYQWATTDGNIVSGETTTRPEVDAPGVYNLSVRNDSNQCARQIAVRVAQDIEFPTAAAGSDQLLNCLVTSFDIEPTVSTGNIYSYLWTTNDGVIDSDPTQVALSTEAPGTYVLSVLNERNSCLTIDTLLITQDILPPTPDINPLTRPIITCDTREIVLDASASLGQGNLSYQWVTPNGNYVGSTNGVQAALNIPGIYQVIVTDSENGCTAMAEIEVDRDEAVPNVLIAAPDTLTCAITEVILDAGQSDQGNRFAISWQTTNGGNITAGDTTYFPTVNATGTYRITIINTDNGCSSFRQVEVRQDITPPLARASSPEQLDCDVFSVPLFGNGSSTGAVFSYEWSTANGQISGAVNQLRATATRTGLYTLMVTDADNGCTALAQTQVSRNPNTPNAYEAAVFQPECLGDPGRISIFEVAGGNPPYEFSIDGSPFSANNHFQNLAPGMYTVRVRDAKGCEYEEDFEVVDAPPLTVDLPEELNLTLGGQDVQILADVQPPPDSNAQIIWTPLSYLDFQGDTLAPFITSFIPTNLRYRLTVINDFGCEVWDEVEVKVDKPKDVYFPNTFSPNNDGVNDFFFMVAGNTVEKVRKFLVFNRWGERMYLVQNFDPRNFNPSEGWDGTFRNEDMNPGVYVYYAEVEFIDGRVEFYEGDITLVR